MSELIATEAGHYYDKHGNPVYEVPYADKKKKGQTRPTNLRDCKDRNLVPSVTVINKMLLNEALEGWKRKQIVLAALTLPMEKDESLDRYAARIQTDAREQATKAADKGREIHAAIEFFLTGKEFSQAYAPYVIATAGALQNEFGSLNLVSEKSFANSLGYGGKVDLASLEGNGVVVDVKTKEFGPEENIKGYEDHCRQLAAYRHGLGIPLAKCANIFVSVNNPGLVKVVHWSEEDLQREFAIFKRLVEIWQISKKYVPNFEEDK